MRFLKYILMTFLCVCTVHAGLIEELPASEGNSEAPLSTALLSLEELDVADNSAVDDKAFTILSVLNERYIGEYGKVSSRLYDWVGDTDEADLPSLSLLTLNVVGTAGESLSEEAAPKDILAEMSDLLENRLKIDWSGEAQVKGSSNPYEFTQIPEPASVLMVLLASLSGIFIRRRFR